MSGVNLRERRQFNRVGKACPVWFVHENTQEIKAKTLNLSDGGMLCVVKEDEVPWHVGDFVRLRLNVPRETPNTYFLESMETDGRVVRFDVARDVQGHLVALAFHPRLDLGLRA